MTDLAAKTAELHPEWRQRTQARIGLGRTGASQPLRHQLAFQLAHAQARDAVHTRLNAAELARQLESIAPTDVLLLRSAAPDRASYLCRPDLGRVLERGASPLPRGKYDLAIVVADGLSAIAVERHAAPLLERLFPLLSGWHLAPLAIVEQGRVAIGDPIGEAFGASIVLMLIGERPGLSSPDSLGAYVTWNPKPGRVDAERNCISNIRSEGLEYAEAAQRLHQLLLAMRKQKRSGVTLELSTFQNTLEAANDAPPSASEEIAH